MKYISLILFFLLSTSLYATEANKDPYENITYIKLENGFQAYLLNDDKAANTQIELTVDVGTDIESKETYGLSHLVEHMVFRDKRVPHRDYVDYIKEEGATYMNGYTTRYKTGYKAVINNNKSYWIVKTFSKMLFNKEVEMADLNSERGAVQTEIGAYKSIDKPLFYLKNFFELIAPPNKTFYEAEFSLKRAKELPPNYLQKLNNQQFTMKEILDHYDDYYYPANMTMKIAGNFDTAKMKNTIQNNFGSITKTGNKRAVKPTMTATLNNNPYYFFEEGGNENYGSIGAKFILDDYKKYLVLDSYMRNLATRLQQKLRNELGQTYSINSYEFGEGSARVITLGFDALNEKFETNIKAIKEMLATDIEHISDQTISKSLAQYNKYYSSVEHNTKSLFELINTSQYLLEQHDIKESSYSIFNSIDPEFFRTTIQDAFKDKNMYYSFYREYYFFPYDTVVLSILILVILLTFYFKLPHLDKLRNNNNFNYRNILLSRRLSNRFLGFIYILLIFIASTYIWEWIKFFILTYTTGNSDFLTTIDLPYSYLWGTLDELMNIIVFFIFMSVFIYV